MSLGRLWTLCPFILVFACNAGDLERNEDAQLTESEGDTSFEGSPNEGTADSDADDTDSVVEVLDHKVITYTSQPMVVDVDLWLNAAAELELEFEDQGLDIEQIVDEEGSENQRHYRYRIRGLQPQTEYDLKILDDNAIDASETLASFSWTTEAPLPGYQATFTVSQKDNSDISQDYRLFDLAPWEGDFAGVYMIDREGQTRFYLGEERNASQKRAFYTGLKLRDDGSLLYISQNGVWIRDELGSVLAHYNTESINVYNFHHEVIELPNGNFMMLTNVFQNVDYPEPKGNLDVMGDEIIEINAEGDVVWRWNSFDHLDVNRDRGGFNNGQGPADWTHSNGLLYDPATDTLLLSARHQDWLINIDHKSGEVLWRLGEDGDFTLNQGTWFYHQHSPYWLEDGSLLLYDNGVRNPNVPNNEERSRAVRYAIDFDSMTASLIWAEEDNDFKSSIAGDINLLSNGNYLVLDSSVGAVQEMETTYARIREIDPNDPGESLWSIESPLSYFTYRCEVTDRFVGRSKDDVSP